MRGMWGRGRGLGGLLSESLWGFFEWGAGGGLSGVGY